MKKTQNVREGTRKGASRRKKELALALCVSLWTAGGSVARANSGGVITTIGNITAYVGSLGGSGNTVVFDDKSGTFSGVNSVYGGRATAGDASGNTVTIGGNVSLSRNVFGGRSEDNDATWNTLTINSGTITDVIYGGRAGAGKSAFWNKIVINGGIIKNNFHGGHAENGPATNNTVILNGGTFSDNCNIIYGGWIAGSGTATQNTVILGGGLSADALSSVALVGGMNNGGDHFTGNTLAVCAKELRVHRISNFENLNFYLPSNIAANDTMLTITGNNATNLTGVTFGAAALTGVSLVKGDTVDLIYNTNGLTTDGTLKTTGLTTPPKATSLTVDKSYKFAITKKDASTIIATVSDVQEEQNEERTEQAKSLVETKAATTTFVNAGADMLASQGFAQAANAVALEAAENGKPDAQGVSAANSFTPFAAFGGSSLRAESGSYVDTKGFGLNVGFAKEFSNAQGKLLFGPVVEYGGGSYDSYLDDGTHGEGGAHYFGVGVMARQVNHDGFYYEGSLEAAA